LKLTDKLFLFSFDLIELNQFYNYFIYCLFILLDFIFIAYYPLNQMYSDYTVQKVDKSSSTNGQVKTKTVTYYDKNFNEEHKDNYLQNVVKYLSIDYFLDNADFEQIVSIQGMVCHGLISILLLFLIMILTRQLGTINLSS
jgi:hypothetical protein